MILAIALYCFFGLFVSLYMIREMVREDPHIDSILVAFFFLALLFVGWPIVCLGALIHGLGFVLKTVLGDKK